MDRPYARRYLDTFKLPRLWVLTALLAGVRFFVGLLLDAALGPLLRHIVFITVPALVLGVAVAAAFADPYSQWAERRR